MASTITPPARSIFTKICPMHHLLPLLLALFACTASPGTDTTAAGAATADRAPVTTYYFIRHAEKDLTDRTDPALTAEGEARAREWARYFSNKDIDLVYSTQTQRTQRTAAPTAAAVGVEVRSYSPDELPGPAFRAATTGKNVLVVGHSNTIPDAVNRLTGKREFSDIDESEYGHLYRVTLRRGKAKVRHREFD